MRKMMVQVALLLTLAIVPTACRDSGKGDYVRLAGNVFIFNYRLAVATYVISLQRLRPIPEGSEVTATFDDPAGGEKIVVQQKVFPGDANIAVESPPVYCIVKDKPYAYSLELKYQGEVLQTISGAMRSTLSQDTLPDRPLVVGPGYDKNDDPALGNKDLQRALKIDRCGHS